MRTYAIGDIHGHLDALVEVHARIRADQQRHDGDFVVVHIGDLIDRGPDSPGVLDFLIDGLSRGERWIVLKGNHDRMMALFLRDPMENDPALGDGRHWLIPNLAGRTTLAQYGVDTSLSRPLAEIHAEARRQVPERHRRFLETLPLYFETDDALFVHAGIRPGIPIEQQAEDDLVWIRDGFLDDTSDHGKLVVHGHTPVPSVTLLPNRLDIDTGVAFGGPLSAVVIENGKVWNLTDEGRVPVIGLSEKRDGSRRP